MTLLLPVVLSFPFNHSSFHWNGVLKEDNVTKKEGTLYDTSKGEYHHHSDE